MTDQSVIIETTPQPNDASQCCMKRAAIPPPKSRVALITGASSGIGAATARRLAAEGLKVVVVARRLDRLEKLAQGIKASGGKTLAIAADLSSEGERLRVWKQAKAECGRIDILVNNAGLGWYGYGHRMPWPVAQQMLRVNTEALVHLSMLCLPEMHARAYGHIINIGSIAGSLPEQGIVLYGATKAFADAFTTSLYRELRGTGVHVSIIRAGPVATEFYATALACPGGGRVPAERFAVSADAVARRVWWLLRHPRRIAYVPGILWFAPWVEACFGWLIDRLGPLLLRRQAETATTK